ncbi:hypothetical protein KKD52_09215 [Myxococcota bacterium]|nr:hypothetical protein [Myxococcota bacterium]MBU1510527.1 hypothetical protein [Myxococcota bacterium]
MAVSSVGAGSAVRAALMKPESRVEIPPLKEERGQRLAQGVPSVPYVGDQQPERWLGFVESIGWTSSYDPLGLAGGRNLHALILIRIIFKMHLDAVVELKRNQSVVYCFTSYDLCIHDVVETGLRPFAFLPMGNLLAVTEQVHWGLDGETDVSKGELKIKLSNPQLCRELTDDRREVKVFGYPVHTLQSNQCLDGSA